MSSATACRSGFVFPSFAALLLMAGLAAAQLPHDRGDAPEPAYPTLLANNGARHLIAPGVYLGAGIDAEGDGQPSSDAGGDDLNGSDDEDGVTFTSSLIPGQTATLTVIASVSGYLDAWIDFGGNDSWSEPTDRIFLGQPLAAGANHLAFGVPPTANTGLSYARFRFNTTSDSGLANTGPSSDGEVEDYRVSIVSEPPPAPKWLQAPDFTTAGVAVDATYDFDGVSSTNLVADDFECQTTGAITNIVVWGAWQGDLQPLGNPTSAWFSIWICADIPAEGAQPSRPGAVLWRRTYLSGGFKAELANQGQEGWYAPTTSTYTFPGDSQCWKYTFPVPATGAFVQRGAPGAPVIYWLVVQAWPDESDTFFGWKTSTAHWNDAASWCKGYGHNGTTLTPWQPLAYPPQHPLFGQAIDLAFELSCTDGEPAPSLDFGDAPDPSYPTLLDHDGARHIVDPAECLGTTVDAEPNGQPDAAAAGDDAAGVGDEDGVVFVTPLEPGHEAQVEIHVTSASGLGRLKAWIDWNANGSWEYGYGASEEIISGAVSPGLNVFTFYVPAHAVLGPTAARFRYTTSASHLLPHGVYFTGTPNGEVEDYLVNVTAAQEPPAGYKWLQSPDLTALGMDVNATFWDDRRSTSLAVLGDDFLCLQTGPLTNIVLWGSWLDDDYPLGPVPSETDFFVTIHANLPADQGTPWNRPGAALWSHYFLPGQFQTTLEAGNLLEGWHDPATESYQMPGDTNCWRYALPVATADAFVQTSNTVYWLCVQAWPYANTRFGWKTASTQWNAAATWCTDDAAPSVEPPAGPWSRVRYPFGHPFESAPVDLAFELHGKPQATYGTDWGDAPAPYPTLNTDNGARHTIVAGSPFLGSGTPDSESDGQPNPLATGDDLAGADDENGVVLPASFTPGVETTVSVTVTVPSGSAYVGTWFDWNADGDWYDTGELKLWLLPSGTLHLPITPPANAVPGTAFVRVRIATDVDYVFTPYGAAPDGEVEDYAMTIAGPAESYDFGDAPDPSYPTLLSNDGARHALVSGVYLGFGVDADPDGQPAPIASGDDASGMDDEDGVLFTNPLVRGAVASVSVEAMTSEGWLAAWFDWNVDGDWDDAGESVEPVWKTLGLSSLNVSVPTGAALGQTVCRFRYCTSVIPTSPRGALPDGEVEDYVVTVHQPHLDPGDVVLTSITATNTPPEVTLRWQPSSPASACIVQRCADLQELPAPVWTNISGPTPGGWFFYTNDLPGNSTYYRLVAPYALP